MKEFRDMADDSQTLYKNLIAKQETSIKESKQDLSNSSSKDSYDTLLLLNQQSEERIQSKILYHTGFMLIFASLVSLVISYFLHR